MTDETSPQRPTIVYKILLQSQWLSWKATPRASIPGSSHTAHVFKGAGIDIQDGYIHLSTAEQSAGTYEKWFAPSNPAESGFAAEGQASDRTGEPLVLVEVDLSKVIGRVEWEYAPSRGEAFAHVYDGGIPFVPSGETGHQASAVRRLWEGKDVKMSLFDEIKKD